MSAEADCSPRLVRRRNPRYPGPGRGTASIGLRDCTVEVGVGGTAGSWRGRNIASLRPRSTPEEGTTGV